MPRPEVPPEPWRSFFADLDSGLTEQVCLHCCGGFVVTQLYGVARTTSDVDFLGLVPNIRCELADLAGKGSPLHKKHKIYLDAVTVVTPPESYEDRLVPCFQMRGSVFGCPPLKLTIWPCPSWSEISNATATTFSASQAQAI
jgi:hypothetical protein